MKTISSNHLKMSFVMAGLDPAIHVFCCTSLDVDARKLGMTSLFRTP